MKYTTILITSLVSSALAVPLPRQSTALTTQDTSCEALASWKSFKKYEEMQAEAVDQTTGTIKYYHDDVDLKDVLARVPKQFRGRVVIVCNTLTISSSYNLAYALVVRAMDKVVLKGDQTIHIIPETKTHIRIESGTIEGGKLLLSSQHENEGTYCMYPGEEHAVHSFPWNNDQRDSIRQIWVDGKWNDGSAKVYPEFLVQNPWGLLDDRAAKEFPRFWEFLNKLPSCVGARQTYNNFGYRPMLCTEDTTGVDLNTKSKRLFAMMPLPREYGGVFATCTNENKGQCANVKFCRGRTQNAELMQKAWDEFEVESGDDFTYFDLPYTLYQDLPALLMDLTKTSTESRPALESRVGQPEWNNIQGKNYLTKSYMNKVFNTIMDFSSYFEGLNTDYGVVPVWPQRDQWVKSATDKTELSDMAGVQGWLKYSCERSKLNWDVISTPQEESQKVFDSLRKLNTVYGSVKKDESSAQLDSLVGQIQSTLALQTYMHSNETLIPRYSPNTYVERLNRLLTIAQAFQTESLTVMDTTRSVDSRYQAVESLRKQLRTDAEQSTFVREQIAGQIKDSDNLLNKYMDKMDASYAEIPALQQKLEDGLAHYEMMEGLRAFSKVLSIGAKKKDPKVLVEAVIPEATIKQQRDKEVQKAMRKYNAASRMVTRATMALESTGTQLQTLYDSTAAVIASADPFAPLPLDDTLRQHLLNISNSFNIAEIAGYSRSYEELAETGTTFLNSPINKDINGAVDYKANMITITITAKAVAQEMSFRAKLVQEYVRAVYAEVLQKQTLAIWEKESTAARNVYVNSINTGLKTLQNEFSIKESMFERLGQLCDAVFFSTTSVCKARAENSLNYGSSLQEIISNVNAAITSFQTANPGAYDGGVRQLSTGIKIRVSNESYVADLKKNGRVTIPWTELTGDAPNRMDFEGMWGICATRVDAGLVGAKPKQGDSVTLKLTPSPLNIQRDQKFGEVRGVTSVPVEPYQIAFDFAQGDTTDGWSSNGYTQHGEVYDPNFQYYCGSSLRDWTIEADSNLDLTGLTAIDLAFDVVSYSR